MIAQTLAPPWTEHAGRRNAAPIAAAPSLQVGVRHLPVGGRAQPSGDFHDVFLVDAGKTGIFAGDACGSGAAAAPLAVAAHRAIAAAAASAATPAATLLEVNRTLTGAAPADSGEFVTAALAHVAAGVGRIEVQLASAGHVPPLLLRGGHPAETAARGSLLGVYRDAAFHDVRFALLPGATLVLVTDGITEARDRGGRFFGSCRLPTLLRRLRHATAAVIAAAIETAAVAHSGGVRHDDMAVAVVAARSAHCRRANVNIA